MTTFISYSFYKSFVARSEQLTYLIIMKIMNSSQIDPLASTRYLHVKFYTWGHWTEGVFVRQFSWRGNLGWHFILTGQEKSVARQAGWIGVLR